MLRFERCDVNVKSKIFKRCNIYRIFIIPGLMKLIVYTDFSSKVRIDDVFADQCPSFMKIDVEGMEPMVTQTYHPYVRYHEYFE